MPVWSEAGYESRWVEDSDAADCLRCDKWTGHCECSHCVVCGKLADLQCDGQPVCTDCHTAIAADDALGEILHDHTALPERPVPLEYTGA